MHRGDFGAVFFRRTTPQIRNEGGLWDESTRLYPLLQAQPKSHDLWWQFPSGAAVSFAHLEHDKTVLNYQGAQIPLVCFDELTHFTEAQFWYLVSRNRSTCGVRPYIRATCNPDADSWVAAFIAWWIDPHTGFAIPERAGRLRWFVRISDALVWADDPADLAGHVNPATGDPIAPKSVTFIPAKLTDNLALMAADPGYMANLMALPSVERARLLEGNWTVRNTRALVFSNWRVQAFETPADAVLRFGADWGFANDPTVLVRAFVEGRRIYVDHEAAGIGVEIDDTPALFAGADPRRPARWTNPHGRPGVLGATAWAITADSARPETVSYMRRKGFRILPAVKGPGSIEDGVAFLQSYEIVVHPRCALLAGELGRYSWRTDPMTGEVLPMLEDKDNNAIDALRYALEGLRRAPKSRAASRPTAGKTAYRKQRAAKASGWAA
jgi:hypothetical protein